MASQANANNAIACFRDRCGARVERAGKLGLRLAVAAGLVGNAAKREPRLPDYIGSPLDEQQSLHINCNIVGKPRTLKWVANECP